MSAPTLRINPVSPEPELIKQAAEALTLGQIVVIPTDTVYGIAQLASPTADPEELKKIKERPGEKNIPLLVASLADLEHYSTELPAYAKELAAQHWPGGLTLVVRASKAMPPQFIGEDGSVALRMPACNIALALMEAAEAPLACSSANISGKPPATAFAELDPLLAERVSLIVDGGGLSGGVPSTVICCLNKQPKLLRPGAVRVKS
ncbi:MAG: L-threonylcarbamoyladenylate synthase [Coriobacteriia bacterium]|nr:L-threonylcarbamoyladenylate synthase [Coriobacteriia bacterium]MCL2750231.1 L-threonylcarbamoyladenylate synthase [Coriobacteriia bacterium]